MSDSSNNNKNIEFIDKMTAHHQAAIDMVNEYYDKIDNKDLKNIMDNILTAQSDEIQQMKEIKEYEESKSFNLLEAISKTIFLKK